MSTSKEFDKSGTSMSHTSGLRGSDREENRGWFTSLFLFFFLVRRGAPQTTADKHKVRKEGREQCLNRFLVFLKNSVFADRDGV